MPLLEVSGLKTYFFMRRGIVKAVDDVVTVKDLSVTDMKKRDAMYHTVGLSVKAFKALTQGRKAWGPRSAGSSALSQASGS